MLDAWGPFFAFWRTEFPFSRHPHPHSGITFCVITVGLVGQNPRKLDSFELSNSSFPGASWCPSSPQGIKSIQNMMVYFMYNVRPFRLRCSHCSNKTGQQEPNANRPPPLFAVITSIRGRHSGSQVVWYQRVQYYYTRG